MSTTRRTIDGGQSWRRRRHIRYLLGGVFHDADFPDSPAAGPLGLQWRQFGGGAPRPLRQRPPTYSWPSTFWCPRAKPSTEFERPDWTESDSETDTLEWSDSR